MSQWAHGASLEFCTGMKMHLADAGTYSCHSLPADSHDATLLWMCGAVCGAEITRKNGNRRKRIPVRCAPYIDMDYTFRNNRVCAVRRAPAGYHTSNASRAATASLWTRLNTNGTGKAKCGDTYKFLFFLLRFSFFFPVMLFSLDVVGCRIQSADYIISLT